MSAPERYYAGPPTHTMDFAELGFRVAGAAPLPPRTDLTEIVMLTNAPVTPGQAVRFRTSGVQGAVPLAQIVLRFTHAAQSTLTHTFTVDTSNPNGELSLPITSAMANGRYRLTSVETLDREARSLLHLGGGTANESVERVGYAGPSPMFFALDDGTSFTVEGASATAPAAQLSRWERDGPDEVAPGSTLRFTVATQSGAFPVQRVSIRITGPFGGTRTLDLEAASGTFSVPVTADWINGPYNVNLITLTEAAGRRVNYLPVGGQLAVGGVRISGSPFPRERFMFTVDGGRDVGPYFLVQPEPATTLPPGRDFVTLYALAVGFGPVTYQWYRGEVGDVSQPLPADLLPPGQLSAATTGPTTLWIRATSAGTTVDSQAARVMLRPSDFGRLTNLSILTRLTDASDSFTLGYVAGGAGTHGPKQILVRAAGPSLSALGVEDTLADPNLQLNRVSALVGENDKWGGAPSLSAAMAAVGAFAYAAPTSSDAAALTTVDAGANHSVRVSGTGAGRVIAELYDAGPNPTEVTTAPRLLNVSVLKELGDGLTVGFSIAGSSPLKILVRAVGPGLAQPPFNLTDAVSDPRLALYRGPTRIALADNWERGDGYALRDAFRSVGAFLLPSASKDAALLATLSPGNYTVQVGASGGGGLVLVEVYEVP
jgi:hypothetical protein